MNALLDSLEANHGKITLWEWVREWLELQDVWEEDEKTPLEEWLCLRSENQDEVDKL